MKAPISTPTLRPEPARRGRLPRQARRRQLLGAAREVFVAQGYHAAAMDEIAERAGVSKPVLYQHFPGKLDLYLALLDEHTRELGDRVREALESTTDNHLRVSRSVQAYFDFVDDPSGAYQLVFESDLRNEPAVRARVEGSLHRLRERDRRDHRRATPATGRKTPNCSSVGVAGIAEVGARWWLDLRRRRHQGARGRPAGAAGLAGPVGRAEGLSRRRDRPRAKARRHAGERARCRPYCEIPLRRGGSSVEVKIGVQYAPRELVLESTLSPRRGRAGGH